MCSLSVCSFHVVDRRKSMQVAESVSTSVEHVIYR